VSANSSSGLSDDALLKQALNRLASSERHMDPIVERIRRARLVALGRSNPNYKKLRDPDDPTYWRSMIFPPIANEQWELLNAEMTVDDPRFAWTPRDPRHLDNARVAEQALDYFNDRDRFARKFRLAMRAVARDGGQVVKTVWSADDYHDGGRLKSILCRMEDIFPDPTATDFDECSFVFHRTRATLDDLRGRTDADGNRFYSNLDLLVDSGGGDDGEQKREGETTEQFEARRTGVHTLHEMWTMYGRVTIANKSVIIRRDEWDDCRPLPFTMIRIIDDEDCIVGVSPMTLIDDIQEAYWNLLNALIDAVNLAVDPPMLVDIEEDPRAKEYVVRPRAKIPARNGESTVKVLQDVASLDKYNVVNLMGALRELMERITGMNSAIAGVSSASTATEAAINVRQGKGRSSAMMSVADECWAQLAQKQYALVQQFASEDVRGLLSNGASVEFVPEQLVDMFITPKPASSERTLKDLERQDAQAAWDAVLAAVTDPASQLPKVDPSSVLRRLLEAFGIDADSVIVGPSGVQQPGGMGMLSAGAPQGGVAPSVPELPPAAPAPGMAEVPPGMQPGAPDVVGPRPGAFLG
jgi:hypothetical protein